MKRGQNESVQVKCLRWGERAVVLLSVDDLPEFPIPDCMGRRMVIKEMLDEGKFY